jgi:hypothetical protein
MSQRARLVLATLTGVAVLVSLVGPAGALGAQSSTLHAHAFSTPGKPSTVDAQMEVAHLGGPNAHVRTKADARSIRCKGCDATAATVHIVLVDAPIRSVQAHNLANSINQLCTNCTTTAVSHQIVVAGPGSLHLSPAGRQALAALEARLEGLSSTGTTAVAEVDSVVNQAVAVLQSHVTVGPAATHPGLRGNQQRPDIKVLRDVDRR